MGRRRTGTARREEVADGTIRLQEWTPSNPTRPSTHVLYISHEERLVVLAYCAAFAAKKAFETALDGDEYKWIDHRTIQTSRGVKIKSNELEEIVEYDFSRTEEEWDYPPTDRSSILRVVRPQTKEERESRNSRLGVSNDNASVERPAKREKTPRPSREGLISVQSIAQELGIEAGEARQILRKAKIEKPEAGWAGDEKWANEIRTVIKKGLK